MGEVADHDGVEFDIDDGGPEVFDFVLDVLFGENDDEEEETTDEGVAIIVETIVLGG